MTKAKQSGGGSPHHCYFWMATLSNGNIVPEFDFDALKHNKVGELPLEFVTQFSWYPVTQTMIERVSQHFNEQLKLPLRTQSHTMNISVANGERLCERPVWQIDQQFKGNGAFTFRVYYALFKKDKQKNIHGCFVNEWGNKVAYVINKKKRPMACSFPIRLDIIQTENDNFLLDATPIELINGLVLK